MTVRVLGLLSGTSVDGVDAAAAAIELAGDTLHIERLGELTLPWRDDLRARVPAARSGEPVGAGEICRLHHDLGVGFGEVAARALSRLGPVDLIASHGQTVHHAVEAAPWRDRQPDRGPAR